MNEKRVFVTLSVEWDGRVDSDLTEAEIADLAMTLGSIANVDVQEVGKK
jgi:hypothetical protein